MKREPSAKYPRIIAMKERLFHNFRKMLEIAENRGVELFAVTKVFCANPEIVKIAVEAGFKTLADSREKNLHRLEGTGCRRVLLRLPMRSNVDEVVRASEISLNSDFETIRLLDEAARKQGKTHGVLIMVDLGDLREGVSPDRAVEMAGEILKLSNIKLEGISVNLTCFGGVIPTPENLGIMVDTAKRIEDRYGIRLHYVNGGNSSSVRLLLDGTLPKGINNLRLGESLVRGRETAYLQNLEGFYSDCFILEAEIVELLEKDSVPTGEIGYDAFGNKPVFQDKGRMLRAIVAIGKQDIDQDGLTPIDSEIEVVGGSSDHTILDLTRTKNRYEVGDIVQFHCDYGAILRAYTGEYVEKLWR